MRRCLGLCVLGALAVSAQAVAQCKGNDGAGRIEQSVLALGAAVTTDVIGTPGQPYTVMVSGGLAPFFLAGVGTICLDFNSPILFELYGGVIPASGIATHVFQAPSDPAWLNLLLFLQGAVGDPTAPGGIALTRTFRQEYEPPDSHVGIGMSATRQAPAVAEVAKGYGLLVSGGHLGTQTTVLSSTEIYSPLLRLFIPGPPMAVARRGHTATALADGRVLIAGGAPDGNQVTAACEIFDIATWTFQPAASMTVPRVEHQAVLLADGRVLAVGGTSGAPTGSLSPNSPYYLQAHASAEIYDPATNTWSPVASSMATPRLNPALATLVDGRVMVIGGVIGASPGSFPLIIPQQVPTSSCDSFDPATESFAPAPDLPTPMKGHQAVLLGSGDVFVAGGGPATASFNGTGWIAGPELPGGPERFGAQLMRLPDGKVLVSGGASSGATPELRCDLYDPATGTFSPAAPMSSPRNRHVIARLSDGSVLNIGGYADNSFPGGSSLGFAELYTPAP